MPRYQDTLDDLRRKYEQTYALWKNQLVYVEGFSVDGDKIAIIYREDQRKPRTTELFDETHLVEIMPDAKFFNIVSFARKVQVPNGACLAFYRNPRKQYQRSISRGNSYCVSPLRHIYEMSGIPMQGTIDISLSMVKPLMAVTYPELHWSIDNLVPFKSIAISERYAIIPSPLHTGKVALLCSHSAGFIGTVGHDKIDLFHTIEQQEVTDYLRHAKLQLPVNLCQTPPDQKIPS